MPASELFYYFGSLAFVILTVLAAWVSFNLVDTLKRIKPIVQRADDTMRDFTLLRQGAKVGIYSLLGKLIGGLDRR